MMLKVQTHHAQPQQAQPVPSWLFIVIGLIGFMLARNGLSVDFLYTAADTLRTLAILGVILTGVYMMTRREDCCIAPPPPLPPPQRMVTMTQQQFQTLMALAGATPTTPLCIAGETTVVKKPEEVTPTTTAAPVAAPEPAAEPVVRVEEKPTEVVTVETVEEKTQ